MKLPYSARITALGGNLITVRDNDLSLTIQNPAALNSEMHNSISIQQNAYFSGLTYGYASYAHHVKNKPVTVHGSIQYISHGKFKRTFSNGDSNGEFSASEFALGGGISYKATDKLSFGTNQKIVMSYLESYNSYGWISDWAAMYVDTSKRISFSFVLRNLGTQISTYANNKNFQPLPFDAQFGFSHRLKYLPLRFSIIAHHLHKWDMRYDDPELREDNEFSGSGVNNNPNLTAGDVVDNIFRHLIFNFELLLGKKEVLRLRVGYDRLKQGELGVVGLRTLSGISGGFGVKIYKFNIDYGFSVYHISGTMHHFGITTRFSDF